MGVTRKTPESAKFKNENKIAVLVCKTNYYDVQLLRENTKYQNTLKVAQASVVKS